MAQALAMVSVLAQTAGGMLDTPVASMLVLEGMTHTTHNPGLAGHGDASAAGKEPLGSWTTRGAARQGERMSDTGIGHAGRRDTVWRARLALRAGGQRAGAAYVRMPGHLEVLIVASCQRGGVVESSGLRSRHRVLPFDSFLDFVHQPRELVSAEAEETLTWAEKGRPWLERAVPTLLWPESGRERSAEGPRSVGAGGERRDGAATLQL